MIYVFYVLSTLLVYYSVRSLIGAFRYLEYFRTEFERPLPEVLPFATVFAPCKGLDEGLRENLERLFVQDYPHYEIVFVVDSERDPAVAVINDLRRTSEWKTSLVIAPKASHSSQKVENLREAVLHADPLSDVFVFVDSDARPAPNWLPSLAAPLADPSIGVSTGYRWFIANPSSFAGELRSMWNASVASSLGENSNFCWGGSMAMRRETFESLEIRDAWNTSLSDDYTIARAVRPAGLDIKFVPQAITPSIGGCSLWELFEFTNRQMKITRVYAGHLWLQSLLGSGLFVIVIAWCIAVLLTSERELPFWWAAVSLTLISAASIGKSILRLRAVRLVLVDLEERTRWQYLWHGLLWCPSPVLFFANCFAGLHSRRVTWRGITYEMVSPSTTIVVNGSERAGE
jgi:ceramide glucosyltransferase